MVLADFEIGKKFYSGEKLWRCTDKGTRVIAAICEDDHEDQSWYLNGPPYAAAESIFDEYDQEGCEPV